jgi:dATP pyrophosphohydrolase
MVPHDPKWHPSSKIPIRAAVVCAQVFKRDDGVARFLILKRKSKYMFGVWQQVAGSIENGETAVEAILRELEEETGQVPMALYSADIVESFYEANYNLIELIPVFVAEFASHAEIVLSDEHSEYKWVSAAEAREHFTFHQQKSSLEIIEREFILKEPPKELRIL